MLLGQAAVAMWWEVEPAIRSEFQNWHSHEHFPERMSVPGFLRGSRWADREGASYALSLAVAATDIAVGG